MEKLPRSGKMLMTPDGIGGISALNKEPRSGFNNLG